MKRFTNMLADRLALVLQGETAVALKREEGQTLVEYALILALIAVVVAGALIFLQGKISTMFSHIGNQLNF